MIKFENTRVMNLDGAFRGMRNPLNSWDKSDSHYCNDVFDGSGCKGCPFCEEKYEAMVDDNAYVLGENDLALAQKLIKAGSDHRKFLRQIFISVDITAPLYWWKEFDTYKVGTVANSCSTMHTIHKKEFTLDDFSHDKLYCPTSFNLLKDIVDVLNYYRGAYLVTDDKETKKCIWYQIIQLLPSSYNQKRTVTLSYENARAIRRSDRQYHKLDEWRIGFMDWLDSLPYAEELITT